jgi:hypothetical protein
LSRLHHSHGAVIMISCEHRSNQYKDEYKAVSAGFL